MKAIAIFVIDSLTSIGKDKSDLARGNFPYRNTKKSTKPLLYGASQKKLTSHHLKMAVPLTVAGVERFRRVGCIVIANLIVRDGVINL